MQALLSISSITFGFIAYHFITSSPVIKQSFEKKWGKDFPVRWIYFQRLTGVFFYGLIPIVLILIQGLSFEAFGIGSGHLITSLLWTAGLGIPVVVLNYFNSRSADNLSMYPQIRVSPPWGNRLILGSALTWTAYLLAYEFLFRGYLLFSCEDEMGKWLAIVINVSIYALVHVPKGWKETVGAVPLGLVLCLLTLQTGTIWIAVGVHVIMALSNEWFSLYYHQKRG